MAIPTDKFIIAQKMPAITIPIWDAANKTAITNAGISQNTPDAILASNMKFIVSGPSFKVAALSAQMIEQNIIANFSNGGATNGNVHTFVYKNVVYACMATLANNVVTLSACYFSMNKFGLIGGSPQLCSRVISYTRLNAGDAINPCFNCVYIDPLGVEYIGLLIRAVETARNGMFIGWQSDNMLNTLSFKIAQDQGLVYGVEGPTFVYPKQNGNSLFYVYTSASPFYWLLCSVDQSNPSEIYTLFLDDSSFSGNGTVHGSICPWGFAIYNSAPINNGLAFILSNDGSQYWPLNFEAQTSAANTALASNQISFKFGSDGTLWLVNLAVSSGNYIGSNRPPGGGSPQSYTSGPASPLLTPQKPIVPIALPCYPACSNPPLLIA